MANPHLRRPGETPIFAAAADPRASTALLRGDTLTTVLNSAILGRQATGFAVVTGVLTAQTAVLAPLVGDEALLPVALGYLFVALVAAAIWGWAVGLLAAVMGNLLLNFFLVPPLHTFKVGEPENAVALAMFLAVAGLGAGMFSLLRRQARIATSARAESEILLYLSNEVSRAVSPQDSMSRVCEAIARSLHASGCSLLRGGSAWTVVASSGGQGPLSREEEALAAKTLESQTVVTVPSRLRGGRDAFPRPASGVHTYVPLPADALDPGVLRLSGELKPPAGVDVDRLLNAFATEASIALQRARLHKEALRVESLEQTNEFKATLLASISHDLRSPLTAIRAAAESARDETLDWSDVDRRAFLDTIASQAARLARVVDGLLEISRLQGGAVRARLEPIFVAQLYDELALGASPALDGRVLDTQAPDGLAFRGDWGLALQAVSNLIENAARYATPGTPIHLTAERSGRSVLLTVADEGPGIPAADLPHIFEKFYRGPLQDDGRGSGLGLPIVKAMTELIGGEVAVRSSPEGTSFTLTLPAAAPP